MLILWRQNSTILFVVVWITNENPVNHSVCNCTSDIMKNDEDQLLVNVITKNFWNIFIVIMCPTITFGYLWKKIKADSFLQSIIHLFTIIEKETTKNQQLEACQGLLWQQLVSNSTDQSTTFFYLPKSCQIFTLF